MLLSWYFWSTFGIFWLQSEGRFFFFFFFLYWAMLFAGLPKIVLQISRRCCHIVTLRVEIKLGPRWVNPRFLTAPRLPLRPLNSNGSFCPVSRHHSEIPMLEKNRCDDCSAIVWGDEGSAVLSKPPHRDMSHGLAVLGKVVAD